MIPASEQSWSAYEPRYRKLLKRPLAREAVPEWLKAWSDLEKDIDETHAWLVRAKDENTADQTAEEAFLKFIGEVVPKAQVKAQELRTKLLELEGYEPPPEISEMVRRLRNQAELFREENVPIQAELETLGNEFNKITGALTVELDGETLTIPQAQRKLLEPDRNLRERAWRAIMAARLEVAPRLDALFLKLLPLRRKLAENAGLPDFRAYQWRTFNRFAYSPKDSFELHEAIAGEVVPLVKERREKRREALGVASLRPWDLKLDPLDPQVDPRSREPLKPFERIEELEEGLTRIFSNLDPELGRQFALLRDGWLDLESRQGKVPGLGYNMSFPRSGNTYIYHSAVGTHTDVWVMLHEAGHAFHSLATSKAHDLLWNRHPGAEFAEVASQAMELLALPYLERDKGGFYTPEEAQRAREEQLEQSLSLVPWTAHADAFQHWLYAEASKDLSIDDIDGKWLELAERFVPAVDWSGLERERAKTWQFVHIFQLPFYMLDYAIAYLGALQIWQNALTRTRFASSGTSQDQEGALRKYREALALGGSRSLPELFEAAGAKLAFDRETVAKLMAFVREQL